VNSNCIQLVCGHCDFTNQTLINGLFFLVVMKLKICQNQFNLLYCLILRIELWIHFIALFANDLHIIFEDVGFH
jgi:hypothetical protein